MKSFVYGGSVRGEYHEMKGIPNQDAYLYKKVKSYTIMIVADGVSLTFDGECSDSQEASSLVCLKAMKYLKHCLTHKKKGDMLNYIKGAFGYASKELIKMINEQDPSRYLTTLTIGIADKKGHLYYGSVGDSGIIYIDEFDDIHQPTSLKQSNMVHNILEKEHWEFGVVRDVKAAVVATDGILDEFTKELRCDRYVPFNLQFINFMFVYKRIYSCLDYKFNKVLNNLSVFVTADDKTAIMYFKNLKPVPVFKHTPLSQEQVMEIFRKANYKAFSVSGLS